MFTILLLVTFSVAVLVSFLVARLFRGSIHTILSRIVSEEISAAWRRYLTFAIYVVGVSGGVRVWELEKFITPRAAPRVPAGVEGAGEAAEVLVLNAERWTLEVYRTAIGTLQSLAWMLLVFFVFALIAYVIVQARGPRGGAVEKGPVT